MASKPSCTKLATAAVDYSVLTLKYFLISTWGKITKESHPGKVPAWKPEQSGFIQASQQTLNRHLLYARPCPGVPGLRTWTGKQRGLL